jgi:predicted amidohydrolase
MQDLNVTIIQSDLVWENIDANLSRFEDKIKTISTPTDLIVLPEMFSTGFTMQSVQYAESINGKTIKWMARMSQTSQAVVTGSIIIHEGGKYYNRLIWMRPDGSWTHYDKKHLFAMGGEHQSYSAGTERLIVELKGWKICPMICYDLRFPVWARNTEDYDVLIYVANWPSVRVEHWRSLLVARAIENQVYAIGVNRVHTDNAGNYYSGHSAIIEPQGEKLFEKAHVEVIHTHRLSKIYLHKTREKLPFLMDRDTFELK